MKLYGVAIAAVPAKDNPNVISVICTPIAVSDKHREKFEILDNLAFKTKFDSANTQELMDCFIKTVDAVDKVATLQKQSCAENGIDYRPVALTMGEDSKNPIHFNALYMHLFGKRLIPSPEEDAQMQSIASKYHPQKRLNELTQKEKEDTYGTLRCEAWAAEADAEKARDNFLTQYQHLPPDFLRACEKLPELITQCTLRKGSYSKGFFYTLGLDRTENLTQSNPQSYMDEKLLKLRHRHDEGDFSAHNELIDIAKSEGRDWGEKVTRNPNTFAMGTPKGYDKALQEKFPSKGAFLHWDKAYEKAFYDGYKETYLGPHTRRLKLPMDAPNLPFTDPVADMIRDQFEIIKGRRSEDGIVDHPDWRKKLPIQHEMQEEKNYKP